MVRLILLTAPIASICTGVALGYLWAWGAGAIFGDERPNLEFLLEEEEVEPPAEESISFDDEPTPQPTPSKKGKGKKFASRKTEIKEPVPKASKKPKKAEAPKSSGDAIWTRAVRFALVVYAAKLLLPHIQEFRDVSEQMAQAISHPTIITKARNSRTGETVVVDDYREAYFWLRDNTPEDARVLAWCKYDMVPSELLKSYLVSNANPITHIARI